MHAIPPPADPGLIKKELTPDKFVKKTNYGGNEIYIFNSHNAPVLMREVGRLREISFRDAGGGTGKALDIDEFDEMDPPFEQLIVWNPKDSQIMGGYRFMYGKKLPPDASGMANTPTAELFRFSDRFFREYWPRTIELGRSWIQPEYQPAYDLRKGFFALDNLWDGLGALITNDPEAAYFFGKITMYRRFNKYARDLILYFLKTFFPDPDELVRPLAPLDYYHEENKLATKFTGSSYEENYRILVKEVRKHHENIPPLVNAYMNLSATMRSFGTSANPGFGEVEETGIIITIGDIHDAKKERHISTQE